ncbi:unnamed protein product [Symbiodinium pilosum]|uniref:Aminoglycoside phosphotransferase domain-containing protein n=1 Tax=Symbiodinium pilosum TaxID=2952 RepID=A0A812K3E3_SYMPI|nr:unnamed protein product [Symbiodinium pilosum]
MFHLGSLSVDIRAAGLLEAGFLAGPWGECLAEATVREHAETNQGQAGQVIDFLDRCGHRRFGKAADKLERATHKVMRKGGFHACPPSEMDPQVWGRTRQLPIGVQAITEAPRQRSGYPVARSSSSSSSSSSSGSSSSSSSGSSSRSSSASSEHRLDPETKSLCRSAAPEGRIDVMLEKHVSQLPLDVVAEISKRGATISSAVRLKSSFHSTWLVEVEPFLQDQKRHTRVIVQILGAEVGDHALSFVISAKQIDKAMQLARRAGLRVPDVILTGSCETEIGNLDFIVQEFIITQTVEDIVKAPRKEWHRMECEILTALKRAPIVDPNDAAPMLYLNSLDKYLLWLRDLVPPKLTDIVKALDDFRRDCPSAGPSPAILMHQDINNGNLLASKVDEAQWKLDAVIDWETAAVGPSELAERPMQEQWRTALAFGDVVKDMTRVTR